MVGVPAFLSSIHALDKTLNSKLQYKTRKTHGQSKEPPFPLAKIAIEK
jgi:hypothetical protein